MSSTTVQPADRANTAARTDRRRPSRAAALRTKIADSTLIQAVLAGALSFTHIRDVALRYHQDGWKSWVYPLSVDLLTVAAYRVIKNSRRDGGRAPGVAWFWFIVGLGASLAANIADAIAGATAAGTISRGDLIASIIVGMWPAAAFLGSTLLGHTERPAGRPATDTGRPPAAERPAATGRPRGTGDNRPANRPTAAADRPAAPIARPAATDHPTDQPAPIPVHPATRFGDLGPRAATTGELPMAVWVTIGHPLYQHIQQTTGRRPTETALQQALADRSAELVAAGELPAAVGRPLSTSTAKRIRRAIEDAHPNLAPLRLAAATG